MSTHWAVFTDVLCISPVLRFLRSWCEAFPLTAQCVEEVFVFTNSHRDRMLVEWPALWRAQSVFHQGELCDDTMRRCQILCRNTNCLQLCVRRLAGSLVGIAHSFGQCSLEFVFLGDQKIKEDENEKV